MRILQIRFKNLNSLAGEWSVDLTHPAFTADGIFAITGPTGAGKTTLLDAICLALYGRTPRLHRVNRSGNEVMSRHTGDCFAEVTFETPAGRYRCHWSQHRARRRPDGELQAPRHEIANADTGEIFEAKVRGVAEQIEQATGMDFERFTRSMLLAQGGFAAFLQAPPDERAPILEQITGTEIYSRISVAVHERRGEARRTLEHLRTALEGMRLLSPEEEQQLSAELAARQTQETALHAQVEQHRKAVDWLEGIATLEAAQLQIQQEAVDLEDRIRAFAPDRQRLHRARQALELAGDHAALIQLRQGQAQDRTRQVAGEAELPGAEAAARQAEAAQQQTLAQLNAARGTLRARLPVLQKVRELDLQIADRLTALTHSREVLTASKQRLQALQAEQTGAAARLQAVREQTGVLRGELDRTRADETLVGRLTGIREQASALEALHRQQDDGITAFRQHREAQERAEAERQACQERFEALTLAQQDLQAGWQEIHQVMETRLQGRTLADWRSDLAALQARETRIRQAGEALAARDQARTRLAALVVEEQGLSADLERLGGEAGTLSERLHGLEEKATLLETQQGLLQRIEALESARGQLRDDEPCPLCGALDHPYARGNVPAAGETREALDRVRAELKTLRQQDTDLQVRRAQVGKDLERISRERQTQTAALDARSAELVRHGAALAPAMAAPEWPGRLEILAGDNADQLNAVASRIEAVEADQTVLEGRRQALERAREALVEAEKALMAAGHRRDGEAATVRRLEGELSDLRARLARQQDLLLGSVQPLGIRSVERASLPALLEQLEQRHAQWQSRQQALATLEGELKTLEIGMTHRAGQIRDSAEDVRQRSVQADTLKQSAEALRAERQRLLGEQSPETEQQQLEAAVEAAEGALESAREQARRTGDERRQLRTRLEDLRAALAEREPRLREAEMAFRQRLEALGLADEADFQAAGLPESERRALSGQAQTLEAERAALGARAEDTRRQLATARERALTDQPLAMLREQLADQVRAHQALQQAIGGLRQRLADNDTLRKQYQDQAAAIEAQQQECDRWDQLHELIGSADGKKYRNFAQGLTFDMMIGHANRQLQKMTDRYLLIRDEAQPLELNVIDSYQGGEIRSTKNLSGGEGFIVSLALALGLSHMAGRQVRVDSLFLDEGFGTLDDDALDTALQTLAGLREEGKLIGLISHVPALKERIATRIQVTPQTGGTSRISGPGCRNGP
ncbi:AAA family ATPase [Ectothiorhodospira lacustris]|uniref:AAA family ATPase n=1 Tax=Ectothiorhodospira lacustris TaxID=2899127 RepID=UPI00237904F9|nr:AAA family ATPase [Ectothiorhodospira lacustris]